jgi:hypothetical protein
MQPDIGVCGAGHVEFSANLVFYPPYGWRCFFHRPIPCGGGHVCEAWTCTDTSMGPFCYLHLPAVLFQWQNACRQFVGGLPNLLKQVNPLDGIKKSASFVQK